MNDSAQQNETQKEFVTTSWVLWSRSDADTRQIQEGIDNLLGGYSFYPEVDWPRFGYRAPDGYGLLGAWRHPATLAFVFLLEGANGFSQTKVRHRPKELLIYAAGHHTEVQRFTEPVKKIKADLSRALKQERSDAALQKRLVDAQNLRSAKRLMGLLSFFTAIINAFSFYLRKLPPPSLGRGAVSNLYALLVFAVHAGSLLLLLSFIAICLAYTLKYGLLVLRRL